MNSKAIGKEVVFVRMAIFTADGQMIMYKFGDNNRAMDFSVEANTDYDDVYLNLSHPMATYQVAPTEYTVKIR